MSRLAVVALAALACAADVAAQQAAGAPAPCRGQPISEIQVVTRPPYFPREGKWWETPLGIVTSLHSSTRPDVVRGFLIFDVGRACELRRLRDSERILRAQPFIADASIRTYDDGNGGVIAVVETVDELTPVLGLRARSASPYITGVKLGDGNVAGTGRYFALGWTRGEVRDIYGAELIDYQFLHRPWQLRLFGQRGDIGQGVWLVDVTHPYYTDEQRFAWRVSGGDTRLVYGFLRGDDPVARVGFDRRFVDVGGIVRVGTGGRLSLFGVSFSGERDATGLPPTPDSGVSYDRLSGLFGARQNARVNFLWGLRSIHFTRASRFDALDAAQDLRLGFQFGTMLGRSLNALGSTDDDVLIASDLYVGAGGRRTFAMLQTTAEGRQNFDADEWDGIIGSARLVAYQRLAEAHTLVGAVDWAGGWRTRVPFQLRIGHPDGGVRGFDASPDAGAVRLVGRLEDRWFLGKVRDQADVGLALFVDAGRVWAGDAPFGMTTPVRVGAGIGLLAAVPPHSKRTWRLELAAPLTRDGHAHWALRFRTIDANRIVFDREPRDVRFSREQSVPSSVFNWP